MEPITIQEIVNAVNGRLLCGSPDARVTSVSTNSRELAPGALFVPIKGERVDAHQFIPMALEKGAAAVLTQQHEAAAGPGAWIRVMDTPAALQALAAWYRSRFAIPVVGITGSVGKTSTKEMVAAALSAKREVLKTAGNFNSQIGLPLTLFRLERHHEVAVIEMGMSDFGEMARLSAVARPNRAVVTNIGVSHIGQLKTQENIRAEKLHIIDQFDETGVLYLNGDDLLLSQLRENPPCKTIWYGMQPWCDYRAEHIEVQGEETSFTMVTPEGRMQASIQAIGIHNVYNALAAAAVARDEGLSPEEIKRGLAGYQSLAMRQQIHHLGRLDVIDDSYNASPDSVKSGLNVLETLQNKGRKVAVLADMLELGEASRQAHEDLGHYVAECGVSLLIAVGKEAYSIAQGARGTGRAIEVQTCADNREACECLQKRLKQGDAVLVKGSRGMRTDEIVAWLLKTYA